MTDITKFLSRLKKVRKSGKSSWIACCPAHQDNNPSMTISVGSDGRILAHCFAQECGIDDIVEAVGMTVAELMPENPLYHRTKPSKYTFSPIDILSAIETDLTCSLIAMKDVQSGKIPSEEETLAMAQRIGRISMALKFARGEHV